MKKNNMSLTSYMQIRDDAGSPSFNGYNFQRETNLNIIYIRQIKADDK
jgi:hypothetical protein